MTPKSDTAKGRWRQLLVLYLATAGLINGANIDLARIVTGAAVLIFVNTTNRSQFSDSSA
jgi:hypothetical protein